MQQSEIWVDEAAHLLHIGDRTFPCDRDIEALALWKGHALLLSSDTDCLSLWDADGLIRTARVGVYPQDAAVQGDLAWVCGGADGRLYALELPGLHAAAEIPLPGMAERLCLREGVAWVLTLLPEQEACAALLRVDLARAQSVEIARFAGLPGALAADEDGLWIGVSEVLMHRPFTADRADLTIEGFGLPRHIRVEEDAVWVSDPLEGLTARIVKAPRTAIEVLRRGETESRIFSR